MSYQHKVDKSKIPVCNIMGVDIAAVNMKWLLEFSVENIKKLSGDYMCVSNVHTTTIAYNKDEYRSIQNGGVMAIPDGGPLSALGRKHGYHDMARITGPDYMEQILRISTSNNYSHFFYGSSLDTLERLKKIIVKEYPSIKIVGMYSPPFRQLTKEEDEHIVKMINESNPDFVWVGLGAPKQEYWMANHQGKINGFMIGVGAAFDYLAGNIHRAPLWMQKNNLEWLYRLLQEPNRLFMRYFITNVKFIWHAIAMNKVK